MPTWENICILPSSTKRYTTFFFRQSAHSWIQAGALGNPQPQHNHVLDSVDKGCCCMYSRHALETTALTSENTPAQLHLNSYRQCYAYPHMHKNFACTCSLPDNATTHRTSASFCHNGGSEAQSSNVMACCEAVALHLTRRRASITKVTKLLKLTSRSCKWLPWLLPRIKKLKR